MATFDNFDEGVFMPRLDRFDIGRTTVDIMRDLLKRSGGDPMAALKFMVERNADIEDERDTIALDLDKLRAEHDLKPLLDDGELREAHLTARMEQADAEEAAYDDGLSQEDLDYLHDMSGFEDEEIGERPPGWRDPERAPQETHLRIVKR